MPYTTYKILSAEPETTPAHNVPPGGVNAPASDRVFANTNLVAVIECYGDAGEPAIRLRTFADDLTLKRIDIFALQSLASLNRRLESQTAIQAEVDSGKTKTPAPIAVEVETARALETDLRKDVSRASIEKLAADVGKPAILTKYDAAAAAKEAAADAIAAAADAAVKP